MSDLFTPILIEELESVGVYVVANTNEYVEIYSNEHGIADIFFENNIFRLETNMFLKEFTHKEELIHYIFANMS